jgi:hypothetical protein
MPDQCLFRYDGCLSGRCVCRTLAEALLAQRLTSDVANGEYERRRVAELTDEAMRLFSGECRVLARVESGTDACAAAGQATPSSA